MNMLGRLQVLFEITFCEKLFRVLQEYSKYQAHRRHTE